MRLRDDAAQQFAVGDVRVRAESGAADEVDDAPGRAAGRLEDEAAALLLVGVARRVLAGTPEFYPYPNLTLTLTIMITLTLI